MSRPLGLGVGRLTLRLAARLAPPEGAPQPPCGHASVPHLHPARLPGPARLHQRARTRLGVHGALERLSWQAAGSPADEDEHYGSLVVDGVVVVYRVDRRRRDVRLLRLARG